MLVSFSAFTASSCCTSLRVQPSCPELRMASNICSPMVKTGLRDMVGSWKIMDRPEPRSCLISASFIFSTSFPLKKISPVGIRLLSDRIRKIDLTVVVFPQPVSPTMDTFSPASTVKFTPLRTFTIPAYVLYSTNRLRISTALLVSLNVITPCQIAYLSRRRPSD